MAPKFTEDQAAALCRALVEGGTASKVAEQFGCNVTTARRYRRLLMEEGLRVVEAQEGPVEVAPAERHDAAFWKAQHDRLRKEADGLHAMVRELGGLDGLRIRRPRNWSGGQDVNRDSRATLIVHNSDRHYGEVIQSNEINGWNAYDPDICARRVKRFMDAACTLGRRWTGDAAVDGVFYTMGGDEISGDIHDELRETNALTSLQQVEGAASLHVACIEQLADEFGRVHVSAVPGNHGRTTKKPTAKRYGALSYDIAVARMVAKEFRDDERISFEIADGPDLVTVIYNRPVLLTHGDKISTGGGKGFAGPVLPIIRGAKQVQLQYSSTGLTPYLIVMGHYHTSAAPPGILANGSVPGYSEFGFGLRGAVDTPRQWLAVMRQRWGLAERLDVQLEEPLQPEKPRVRMEATVA